MSSKEFYDFSLTILRRGNLLFSSMDWVEKAVEEEFLIHRSIRDKE